MNAENKLIALKSPELYYAKEPELKKKDDVAQKKANTLKSVKNRNSINYPKSKTYQ